MEGLLAMSGLISYLTSLDKPEASTRIVGKAPRDPLSGLISEDNKQDSAEAT